MKYKKRDFVWLGHKEHSPWNDIGLSQTVFYSGQNINQHWQVEGREVFQEVER